MSDQATAVPEWAATLPDDIKPIVSSKGWKDPADAIRSYTNLEKTLGQKRLPAPAADWKPEQYDSFYKELGRPDKSDDYKVPEHKFPDGINFDESRIKEAKAMLHRHGLTPRQAEGLLKDHFETISKDAEATFEARKRDEEAAVFKLKDEWKGDYDVNLKTAKDALAKFGDEEAVKYLNETGLGNHPAMVKMLAKIGKGMLEDTAKGKAQQPGGPPDAAAARVEIDTLKKDKEFMSKFFKGDKESAAKWTELHKVAFPDQAPAV